MIRSEWKGKAGGKLRRVVARERERDCAEMLRRFPAVA